MKKLNAFSRIYPLSKTLRFELRPIGKTLEHIEKSGILSQDQHRAESYVEVKKIIDEYHKAFIENVLKDFRFSENRGEKNSLEEFLVYYMCKSKDEMQKRQFADIQDKLRKQITQRFSDDDRFKRIDKKELIKEDLLSFVEDVEKRQLIEEFKDFTTYFTGFHENRKNMYTDEAQSTAIAYRLIHENLPKFIDNIMVFDKVAASPIAEHFAKLYSDFEEYLNVSELGEMFRLDYYNIVLTQTQIDVYNAIVGGKTLEDGKKIQGLNEYINLYNQQQKDKSARLPKLKPLYKQILSDRNAISWLPEQFQSDEKVLEAIQKAYQDLEEQVFNRKKEGEHSLKDLLLSLSDYDLSKIYIRNDTQMTDISQKAFGHWDVIHKALLEQLKEDVQKKPKKESDEAYEERLNKIIKSQGSIPIALINQGVQKQNSEEQNTLQTYFASLGAVETESVKKENLFTQIENAYAEVKDLLNTPYSGKNLAQDNVAIEKIKTLLDTIKALQHFVKPLLGDGTESEKDEKFYGEFSMLWEELDKITPLYNMVRNYMTRKPYSTEKIKLNFENSTLMNGWDLNKEQDNTTVILRKDGMYYLAIMNKKHNRVFDVKNISKNGECFEKMEYKLLPGANKMLPKVFFSKSRIDEFAPSEQLLENYNKGTHKKGNLFNLSDCHALIDFFKASINKHKDWSKFGFKFSDTNTYEDLSGFYREVEQQGYNISFRNVSVDYINSLVEEGKIYLFQIYNKDFSPYSKGTPNLHTLYWKMLFDEKNLADVVYKLNGQAEVFFRKSSIICDKPTHPANQPIDNKNALNNKQQSVFEYDLVKDKRYTVDKFQFHVPITMNFKSTGGDNINLLVNEYIRQSDDLHIIGIDRGERHLLYLTVIDLQGRIKDKEQYSLNKIVNTYNGDEYPTNYHDLLSKREDERMKARQSWQTIENIKELKEGYLSQVIHKISELIVKYNAIVVLEDLNMGFMRGRQKVESSVYQKFEKMLIDKLNYLVDKKKNPEEDGGVLNAYQLTNKFDSFQKLGKQSGFLFYTQAWNTSKIDPVTGFVNLFDTRYETREKAKDFFGKFDAIRYNTAKDWFEFAFDYSNFTSKAEGSRTNWTLCTYGERIEKFRDEKQNSNWASQGINLTDKFKELFAKYKIDIQADLKEAISQQDSADFFKGLLYLLKLTLQMRNSEIGTEIDYMQSPVADANGNFYNSDTCDDSLPKNADANGAYNIARKGLWIVQQIKAADDLKNVKLSISNKEWLKFAQEKPYLNE
ncbi:MAG: type V CRISPR-associated protein Cas12a/Cpf1 [Paludibacteraceae bacterium]|nr:type V CRISPR-associated protein Cas12a/Cpf1 [Paludibacteraceae bacterium]